MPNLSSKTLYCPLCNRTSISPFHEKPGVSYFRCNHCRFIFSHSGNPNLTNELADFEPAYLDYLADRKIDIKNHRFILDKLQSCMDLRGKSFLDIGCGSGKLVRYLHSTGFSAEGIEPSIALFETFLANENSFFNVTIDEFSILFPEKKFHFIIISDVIEHLEYPVAFLQAARNLLHPGGLIFISTPNSGSSMARWWGKRWHYYNKYHLSIFSFRNLVGLLERSGFKTLSYGSVTRYHSLYYLLKYALNFLFHREVRLPQWLSRFTFRTNLGDNIYLVCRKQSS